MKRKRLTDTYIRTRKPAKPGKRDETMDTTHPRMGLRVTDTGHRSFIYLARFPGSQNPTRRRLGDYPTTTLEEAHKKARHWDILLAKGIDPREEERRLAGEAETAKKAATANVFRARVDDYLAYCEREGHRQRRETARILHRELMPHWGDRPIESITPGEVKGVITEIAERAPYMAHATLAIAKGFFDWALDEASPAAALRPKKVIGKKKPRQRLLDDDEVRALWNGAERMGYPYRDLYRMLLLTGVRLHEAADARWSEIDMSKRRWVIPPERFKSECYHYVPLSDAAVALLEGLPRFRDGDYLFSHNGGQTPVNSFSKAKERLDAAMAEELGKAPAPWRVHDLRRVVRTGLASLRVPDTVAELVLGHGKRGMQRVYDLEEREPDLREALEKWAAKLRDIVTPPPDNVRKLREAG